MHSPAVCTRTAFLLLSQHRHPLGPLLHSSSRPRSGDVPAKPPSSRALPGPPWQTESDLPHLSGHAAPPHGPCACQPLLIYHVERRPSDPRAGSGDVKYHLGTSFDRPTSSGKQVHISLLANPSHLEAVNTVVLGKARARQYYEGDGEGRATMPVLLHGDGAFSGQVPRPLLHLSLEHRPAAPFPLWLAGTTDYAVPQGHSPFPSLTARALGWRVPGSPTCVWL